MTRFYTYTVAVLSILLLTACGGSKELTAAEQNQLDQLYNQLQNKDYQIELTAAYPLNNLAVQQVTNALLIQRGDNSSRIILQGSNNMIKRENDSLQADLAYFGEVRDATYTRNEAGLSFDGVPTEYEVIKKQDHIELNADIKGEADTYDIYGRIYPSGSANILIRSSKRTSIRYSGSVRENMIN